MLIGIAGHSPRHRDAVMNVWPFVSNNRTHWIGGGEALAAIHAWNIATLDSEQRWARDPETGSWLALSGHLFHDATMTGESRPDKIASRLLERLSCRGIKSIAEFEGTFAVAWFDGDSHRLHLIRDRFGIEPFFYAEACGSVLFGSRVRDLVMTGILPGGLCSQGLAEYLTYCYVPSDATLDRDVRQVPAGSCIVIDPRRGVLKRRHWHRLSFALRPETDEVAIATRFHALLEQAVVRQMAERRIGIFLSGGMDSSSVACLVRCHEPGPIHTFAFRCAESSFDESLYARAVADAIKAEHTEVEYGEQQAVDSEAVVEEMDVPFCNVGINVGTWLLGSAAAGRADYVLTGDGGDEFWGSHPVYVAQRFVRIYDQLPLSRLMHPVLTALVNGVADSDSKADFRVKLKRILPARELPPELKHFRWQTYYVPGGLDQLLVPEIAAELRQQDPFRCVLAGFDGYRGPDDGLSPLLYNDYKTSSSYYFKRLRLTRRFGVEARCPFYDHALVEFGTRIPARLKLEGFGKTKRLFRAAMQDVLPDRIIHRTDKLGHSIPLKNWLRQQGLLAARIAEVCGPDAIRARGLFRPDAVSRLLDEHRSRRHNHSHRIWALYVLELWLRARERQCRWSGRASPPETSQALFQLHV